MSSNIHGDGFVHFFIVEESIRRGLLMDHIPFTIMTIENDSITFLPIHYPRTEYAMLSLFYLFGGADAIKLSSPFIGALVALIIYVMFRETNRWIGLFSAFGAVMLNSARFIMNPLLEQYLLLSTALTIFCYHRFLCCKKQKYLLLTGLFLGLSMSIKQTGFIFAVAIVTHAFIYFSYLSIKERTRHPIISFVILMIIASSVSFFPLYDQVQRTGTVGYSPGGTFTFLPENFPFRSYLVGLLTSKFPADSEALSELNQILGYRPTERMSIYATIQQYLLFPLYYNRALRQFPDKSLWMMMFTFVFIVGCWYLLRKDKKMFSIIFYSFIVDFLTAYLFFLAPVYQYHVYGIALLSILVFSGLYAILRLHRKLAARAGFSSHQLFKALSIMLLFLFFLNLFNGYWTFIHESYYQQSGRQADQYLADYERMGDFIQKNTPKDAIFLAAETNFGYYCRRNHLWISEGGGSKIPLIFRSNDPNEALRWLNYYNIDYVLINRDQTKRRGLYDYIPKQGLLEYIDKSDYFVKIYEVDNLLTLYKVLPNSSENPSNISGTEKNKLTTTIPFDPIMAFPLLILLLVISGMPATFIFFSKNEIDIIERCILSLGLSLTVIPVTIMILNIICGVQLTLPNSIFAIVAWTLGSLTCFIGIKRVKATLPIHISHLSCSKKSRSPKLKIRRTIRSSRLKHI